MRWALALVAACRFEPGSLATGDAPTGGDDARRVDAPAISADARICPDEPGCVTFTCSGSSSCYYYCGLTNPTDQTWSGARSACDNDLGCLVTINSQVEQDCIAANTAPSYPDALVWFGYYQSDTNNEPADGWEWECGQSSYLPAPWGARDGEPNDEDDDEDCAALTTGGGWFDADCNEQMRYVCELP